MQTKAKRVTKGRGSSTINGQVPPRRLPNAERRPREYLTPEEVEFLITAAQKRIGARNPHRDATMILLAYRHGLSRDRDRRASRDSGQSLSPAVADVDFGIG